MKNKNKNNNRIKNLDYHLWDVFKELLFDILSNVNNWRINTNEVKIEKIKILNISLYSLED